MTRKLPIIPTILVALAVATMIGLGFWQLERRQEKEALLASYAAAAGALNQKHTFSRATSCTPAENS